MEDFLILEKDSFDLKAELKSIGMTQKDFAEHIDKNVNTISRWIKNEIEIPKIIKLYIQSYKKSKILDNMQNIYLSK
jgi:plasmid maintenance system antidote protein VapI